jgi:hypothetical protein
MILESLRGAAHLLGEAIKVRSLPKKPAQSMALTDAPKTGRPAHSIDFRRSGDGRAVSPSAAPLARPAEGSWLKNYPAVATLTHFFGDARHRLFGSGSTVGSEPEPMILHRECPSAEPHLAKDAGACGLCLSYQMQRQRPLVEMAVACPGCGRGRGHDGDCPLELNVRGGITDEDWVDLPGQVRFDEWADANERRGFLP